MKDNTVIRLMQYFYTIEHNNLE